MVSVKIEKYKNYGDCVNITNGKVEMFITTEFGPRVIYLGIDGTNIMYEDHQDLINKGGEFFDENFTKEDGIWHIYGGHRLWKSPEYMDTYYPDNAKVDVEFIDNGAIFTSNVEKTTKIQKAIKITMNDEGVINIEHKMTNKGNEVTPPISIWGLSVLDKGAKATIPQSTRDTGLLANRNLVLWSYTDIKDERLQLNNDSITLSWMDKSPIKIGTSIEDGSTIVVNTKGLVFTKTPKIQEGEYPDFVSNVECYTNQIMLEIETLGPLHELKPNESMTQSEVWTLTK